jgi:hypothetical protein
MATKTLQKTPAAATSVAVRKNTSVVNISEQIAAQAAAMADRTAPPSGTGIRLAPGSMTLPDGTKTPGPLEVVIVDFVAMNNFYADDFDRNNIVPPTCFAIGSVPSKLAPSPNAPEPQAATCAECPMNAFGSKGKGKACNNERKLAVLPPDADADTPLWTVKVAKMGVKGFDAHVNGVVRTFQTPPVGVVTTMGLDPNVDYAQLTFSDAQPNPNMAVHFARQAEAQALLFVEPDLARAATQKPAAKKTVRPAVRR